MDSTVHTLPAILSLALAIGQSPAPNNDAVRRDTSPPTMSLYLPIALGVPKVIEQSTGVFVPDGYRAGPTVDLALFFRGYDVNRPKAASTVAEYWGSPGHSVLKHFLFRQEVNASGKNVILVVPALGPSSEFGRLAEPGGPQQFLDKILEGLEKNGSHAGMARPSIRHLILAGHSGGGVPLRRVAEILGSDPSYKEKLKECWGFDSTYGVRDKDADFWADWAAGHPGTKVTMYFIPTYKDVGKDPKRPVGTDNPLDHRQPTMTTFPATELDRLAKEKKLDNVRVERETQAPHVDVPRAHLARLLKGAEYLDNR
jgi:hypothetical protein